ncbi:MAG TPA: arginine deiminase family protein [Bryobacteraceae bacterium]|jgi:dimethylargininase|nr:arginine deiminase family protein [Bryobacteraceae bacterium]
MWTAITRRVSDFISRCELEFLPRSPIDAAKAAAQHLAYENCLRQLGFDVISLSPDPAFPDGLFVEDPAVVLDEVAVMCRMGAKSRRGEADAIAAALAPYRRREWIREPATIEGGDVMRIGKTLFCGISRRTNREGARQLAQATERFSYRVVPAAVSGCLHLKSAICPLGADAVIANRNLIDMQPFEDLSVFDVADDEPGAANVLEAAGKIIMPASFPKTRRMLEKAGFEVIALDISELQKAEAGVTCSSLIFKAEGNRPLTA